MSNDDRNADPQAVAIGPLEILDGPVTLHEYDPRWSQQFAGQSARIRAALDERVLRLEHVGSTAVSGLVAKPRIDVLLVVAHPADEAGYVPALEAAGYRLHICEPHRHEHRLLKARDTDVNLHVFGPGSPEIDRIVRFRDHLRRHDADREAYAAAKRQLAARRWRHMQEYADAKTEIVEAILRRATTDESLSAK